MKREDKFVMSHRPYAVDLGSLTNTSDRRFVVSAVWFRRRRGELVACTGYLWDHQGPCLARPDEQYPKDALDFLKRCDTGPYGGTTTGRWDGIGYWGEEVPEIVQTHLEVLRPMLENFPAVPPCFDGWWTFR